MNFKEQVQKLVDEALSEDPSLFLIDLRIGADNSIHIELDGDQGVSLEKCMNVSRKVEHNLDREEQDFSLEVSSSGVGAPLQLPRQFINNLGRKIAITDLNDRIVEGTLTAANEEEFVVQWKTREPKPIGKGKVTVTKTEKYTYGAYKTAKITVSI